MFETTINIYRKLKQEEKSNTMREIAVTPMPSFWKLDIEEQKEGCQKAVRLTILTINNNITKLTAARNVLDK